MPSNATGPTVLVVPNGRFIIVSPSVPDAVPGTSGNYGAQSYVLRSPTIYLWAHFGHLIL